MKQMKGFTLLELMIVVAIIGIISTIAYGSYKDSVTKTRRADAKSTLTDLSAAFERCFTMNGQYNYTAGPPVKQCVQVLGAASNTLASTTSPGGFYTISLSSLTATTYMLTATPLSPFSDANGCNALTINQAGQRNVTGPYSPARCTWQ